MIVISFASIVSVPKLVHMEMLMELLSPPDESFLRLRSYFVLSAARKERFGARALSVAEDKADELKSRNIGSIWKRTDYRQRNSHQ